MRFWMNLLVVVLGLSLAGVAGAADKPKEKKAREKPVRGIVTSVDGTTLKIKPNAKKGEPAAADLVIATDANTAVKVDRKAAKLADVKQGMRVVVTPATGTATKIEAMTPGAKPEKKPAKQDKKFEKKAGNEAAPKA